METKERGIYNYIYIPVVRQSFFPVPALGSSLCTTWLYMAV